ncbi:hypothetical protein G7046_g3435 [Stylonectria norvegica]|nr:hypothetical protein G7046_g3435 [Stylonectria norvegica]
MDRSPAVSWLAQGTESDERVNKVDMQVQEEEDERQSTKDQQGMLPGPPTTDWIVWAQASAGFLMERQETRRHDFPTARRRLEGLRVIGLPESFGEVVIIACPYETTYYTQVCQVPVRTYRICTAAQDRGEGGREQKLRPDRPNRRVMQGLAGVHQTGISPGPGDLATPPSLGLDSLGRAQAMTARRERTPPSPHCPGIGTAFSVLFGARRAETVKARVLKAKCASEPREDGPDEGCEPP